MVKRKQNVLNKAGIFSEDLSDATHSVAPLGVRKFHFKMRLFTDLLIENAIHIEFLSLFFHSLLVLMQSSQSITDYFNDSTSAIKSGDINENIEGEQSKENEDMDCDQNDTSYKHMLDDDDEDAFMLDIDCWIEKSVRVPSEEQKPLENEKLRCNQQNSLEKRVFPLIFKF